MPAVTATFAGVPRQETVLGIIGTAMALSVGEQVGPFTVEQLLQRGGMGEVYLARDGRVQRDGGAGHDELVLLKVPSEAVLGDVAGHARFDREGEALRRLDHPGVQHLREMGRQGMRPYLALQYVEGEPLGHVLRQRGRLPAAEAVSLVAALAQALEYCHAHGVVHRDLKPDNVIITPEGRPVLIDFGSVLLEGARRLTFSGLTSELGTPEYMAPEQVQGKRGDARTDVYALGTLLYEALTGRPPFAARPDDTAVQVMRRHLQETPSPPGAEGITPALEGVLATALARSPHARFPTAAAFRAALLDPEGAVARGEVTPGWPAAGSAASASLDWRSPLDEPQSAGEWLRYGLAALAVIVFLIALALLATWLRTSATG